MPYVDPQTVLNPTAGQPMTAAWGDTVRNDLEFLVDPPSCSVYNVAAQSVASNTLTALNATSENFDNDSMHSTSVNTSRITIQTAGRYLFFVCVRLEDAITTGNFTARFLVNGTTAYNLALINCVTSASASTIISGSRPLPALIVGDYVQIQTRHSIAGNADHTLDEFSSVFITR